MASDFLSKITPNLGGGTMGLIVSIFLGTLALGICALIGYYYIKKKVHWNLKVEFRLPRNLNKIKDENGKEKIIGTIKKEWGKGYYNGKEGIVYIKRKKQKSVSMKPFNIKEFLSDSNILTVIQVGIDDYRPVLEDSYIEVKDYDTGEERALINAKMDTSETKSWRNSYERDRKSAFTLSTLLDKSMPYFILGWVTICLFVGFAILYSKIT